MSKVKKREETHILDRTYSNSTYLMILMNNYLGKWASAHHLSIGKDRLRFILTMESDNLADVHLSLSYDGPNGEEIIPAGYVGQRLNKKEETFCKSLPHYTPIDLINKPPFDVVMNKFEYINDTTGIVETSAHALSSVMIDTCHLMEGVDGSLATANGSAILFLQNKELYVTKIELYVKDIMNFIMKLGFKRSTEIRNQIQSILPK